MKSHDDEKIVSWLVIYDHDLSKSYQFFNFDKLLSSIIGGVTSYAYPRGQENSEIATKMFEDLEHAIRTYPCQEHISVQFCYLYVDIHRFELNRSDELHKTLSEVCNALELASRFFPRLRKLQEKVERMFTTDS